jgi:protein-tyrosine kinase
MIIFDAIQKAKRLGDTSGRRPATPEAQKLRRRTGEAEAGAIAHLSFEQLPIDERVYERNRVLMLRDQGHAYSSVLDSYRILRTRIWHRAVGSEQWSSLAIVSPSPGDGKTLTSINLALAFAREKKQNVFLLDLDLRNPSMCRYLGVAPKVGIGSVLTGDAKPEEAFFGIGVENLVLAGGLTSYENSSEMLGGERLPSLLAYIKEIDPRALILVDLPPLLISADSLVVVPKLSAVLLVVAEGATRRDNLKRAIDVLSGSTFAGIVLNRSREAVEDYYG